MTADNLLAIRIGRSLVSQYQRDMVNSGQEPVIDADAINGISCEACHKVEEIAARDDHIPKYDEQTVAVALFEFYSVNIDLIV